MLLVNILSMQAKYKARKLEIFVEWNIASCLQV